MENVRCLTEVINNEAKEYAIYTVEQRAIPNMIDGMKPVHRFMLYRAMQLAKGDKEKMHKLASVAGGVADAGYHHGEGSAQDAGALMANTWSNNFPFLDGEGNFGSRLVQQAAASRYIFCRISENFSKVFKDENVAPVHEDPEHKPPRFYLPVIPVVLLNGVEGIATGYATNILPHSIKSVIECTRQALNGVVDIKEPSVEYPKFSGKIYRDGPKCELHGTYKITSKTQMEITEIPYSFDRAKYVEKVLDPLEDKGFISYSDNCGKNGFGFKIKMRKEAGLELSEENHDKIMKMFGLIERLSQNITVIDENGKLRVFESAVELIKHFVEVRTEYVKKRIHAKIIETDSKAKILTAKARFINAVIKGDIVIAGKTRKQLVEELKAIDNLAQYAEELVLLNIYHITSDEARKLALAAKAAIEDNQYWRETTAEVEYQKDLDQLDI